MLQVDNNFNANSLKSEVIVASESHSILSKHCLVKSRIWFYKIAQRSDSYSGTHSICNSYLNRMGMYPVRLHISVFTLSIFPLNKFELTECETHGKITTTFIVLVVVGVSFCVCICMCMLDVAIWCSLKMLNVSNCFRMRCVFFRCRCFYSILSIRDDRMCKFAANNFRDYNSVHIIC